jgi:hypothetical protein
MCGAHGGERRRDNGHEMPGVSAIDLHECMSGSTQEQDRELTAGFHTRRLYSGSSWSFSMIGLGQFHLYMSVKNLARMVAPQAMG